MCCTSTLFTNIYIHAAEILEPLRRTKSIIERENITLRCIGIGHPPPLVQWRKLNGSLSDRVSSTNMSMSTNEGNITRISVDLIFTGTYREDTGVYKCIVSNLLNNVTGNVSLTVQCMQVIKFSLTVSFSAIILISSNSNYVFIVTM